jgi:hypothetical protein
MRGKRPAGRTAGRSENRIRHQDRGTPAS